MGPIARPIMLVINCYPVCNNPEVPSSHSSQNLLSKKTPETNPYFIWICTGYTGYVGIRFVHLVSNMKMPCLSCVGSKI